MLNKHFQIFNPNVFPPHSPEDVKIKLAVSGPIAASASSLRDLTSSSLRHLICVEGVYISADPSIEPNVISDFYWTSKAPKSEFYTETSRAKMWKNIFEEGIESGACVGLFRNNLSWTFDSAINSYSGTSILNGEYTFLKNTEPRKCFQL